MAQWTVRYHHNEPEGHKRADGWWVLGLTAESDTGSTVNVLGLVDPRDYDLVIGDAPTEWVWPAVARWVLMDLPGFVVEGTIPDGTEVRVPGHQVRRWALDPAGLVAVAPDTEVDRFDA